MLSQLSKSESLIVVGRIRNACRTDPVDFGNATLSLPANNLSRPHGGGNITNLYILHDNSGRIISKVWEVTLLSFSLKLLKQPSTISFFFKFQTNKGSITYLAVAAVSESSGRIDSTYISEHKETSLKTPEYIKVC